MLGFSKRDKRQPYRYSALEMRKNSGNSVWWILGAVLIIGILLFVFNSNNSSLPGQPKPSSSINNQEASQSGVLIIGKRTKITGCISVNGLPDKECTPGDIDLKVTQDNISQTICVSGYTKTVRPPVSYTDNLKIKQIQEYGYSDTNTKDYEEDHLISLELGGSPASEANLWPEPYDITDNARDKDKVENYLHDQVCSGEITLKEAQLKIASNWVDVYNQLPSK